MLVKLRPSRAPEEIARVVKSNSSRWVHETLRAPFDWQDGYTAFSVSRSGVDDVSAYIERHPRYLE
jgi:hypothetical protein